MKGVEERRKCSSKQNVEVRTRGMSTEKIKCLKREWKGRREKNVEIRRRRERGEKCSKGKNRRVGKARGWKKLVVGRKPSTRARPAKGGGKG